MPGSRIPRCSWIEAGQRCRRSASGADGLCTAHRVAAKHVAQEPQGGARTFGAGFGAVLDDFLSGRKISDDSFGQAIDDLAYMFGGNHGPHHEIFNEDVGDVDPRMPPINYPPGYRPPRRAPPPPPPDPKVEERRAARLVLGFPDGVPLTEEMISSRRKELARRHHPDRGGSLERMQAVNAACDLLLEALA